MSRPPVIVVQLIHIQGPLKGEILTFSERRTSGRGVISIGRHESCYLRFPANLTSISRKHAEMIREGNQFKLIDHSANGTFVNGKRVKEIFLKNGDVLEFAEGGPKVSFLAEIKEEEGGVESLPPPPRAQKPEEPAEAEVPEVKPRRPPVETPRVVPPVREEPAAVSGQIAKVPLVIQYGPTLRSYKELPVTLGKNPKCDFVIDHPAIFDQHAQIFFSQNQYWIKDLTGQEMVQVNRAPIPFQAPLRLNDDISLSPRGPAFRFLGEGRLAEIAEPPVEESAPPSEKKEDLQGKAHQGKGLKSVLKKWLGD